MPATEENPKTVFRKLPRKNLANFRLRERGASESFAEFLARNRITDEEIAWVQSQPVVGAPSLRRLRAKLGQAGFAAIKLDLYASGEVLDFKVRLTPQVMAEESDSLVRLWIRIFRESGFNVGFCEVGISNVDGTLFSGLTLTGPIDQVAEHGAPAIELEHAP
jgi:hypothetical protein